MPSSDGRHVAYVLSCCGGTLALHVVRADGTGDRVVNAHVVDAYCAVPVWSADSRRVFTSCVSDGRSPDRKWTAKSNGTRIVVDATSGQTEWVVGGGRSLAWSPDSRLLGYVGADGIRVLDVRTGRTRRLSEDAGFGLPWSPDGADLAFLKGRGPGSRDTQFQLTGDMQTVTRSGRVRVVVSAAGAFGGPILSFAWARAPSGLRYRAPSRTDGLYTGWRVTDLAADGGRVAYATCAGVFVWDPATGADLDAHQFEPSQCDPRSNYLAVFSLALAGDRVAYSTGYGGNTTVWSIAGSLLAPTQQDFVLGSGSNTCCLINPEVTGAGDLLIFDTRTEVVGHYPNLAWQIRRVGPAGCPCATISEFQHRIGEEVHLDDVDADRIVVDRPYYLRILDSDGKTLLALPVNSREAVLSGTNLIVHVGGELRDYDATTGGLLHTWQPTGLQAPPTQPRRDPADHALQDTAHGLAAYTLDGRIHLLRLSDGQDTTVAAGTLARFIDGGLVYADGARIHLIPYDRLPLR